MQSSGIVKDWFSSPRNARLTQIQRESWAYMAALLLLVYMVTLQGLMMMAHPIGYTPLQPYVNDSITFKGSYLQSVAFLLLLGLTAWLEKHGMLSPLRQMPMRRLVYIGALGAVLTANIGSIDFFDYIAYGYKLGVLHMTPFKPLTGLEYDPIIGSIPRTWFDLPSFYGPTAVLYFTFLAKLVPVNFILLLISFKMGWFAAFMVFTWLLHRLLAGRPFAMTRWLALSASPALWVLCLRDAHAEMLMLTALAGAFLACRHQKWTLGGVLLGMVVSIKAVMLAIVPFFAWYAFITPGEGTPWERARWVLLGFICYVAPLYIMFNGGELRGLLGAGLALQNCPQPIPGVLLKFLEARPFGLANNEAEHLSRALSNWIMMATLAGMFLWVIMRKTPFNLPATTACAMIIVLLTRSWNQPWYSFWFALPLILIARTPLMIFAVNVFVLGFSVHNKPFTGVVFMYVLITAASTIQLIRWLMTVRIPDDTSQP